MSPELLLGITECQRPNHEVLTWLHRVTSSPQNYIAKSEAAAMHLSSEQKISTNSRPITLSREEDDRAEVRRLIDLFFNNDPSNITGGLLLPIRRRLWGCDLGFNGQDGCGYILASHNRISDNLEDGSDSRHGFRLGSATILNVFLNKLLKIHNRQVGRVNQRTGAALENSELPS